MSGDPLRLDALLESVADGSDVDWDAAEAAADEDQRRIVRNLRLVARIADVHRTIPDEISNPAGTSGALRTSPIGRADSRWGHLVLLEPIGAGAFGRVYRARDPWLDREVALKLLKPDVAGPGRMIHEARALARLRHPNVVTVHGADVHDGSAGLWMELVRGRTLAAIVASAGPFSAAEAVVIGHELCRAVAAVHAAGLVHRDIKAQNVMREAGGRLVLMDFGAGHTPLYAAPELLNGGEATVATDLYALGVLLYYLVTGKYPVSGSSSEDLKLAHARGERKRLAEVRPDLPTPFIAAIERALDPDPARRYAGAWEMHEVLQSSGPPAFRRWVAAAALILTLGGTVAYFSSDRLAPPVAYAAVKQVAVMPLQAMNGTDSYIAAGLTEALTQELSITGPLKVVSRTSIERAASDRTPLSALATMLNADAVIEGSVSRADAGSVLVNVRVIHAGSNTAVWARTFTRSIDELSTMAGDIAGTLSDEFRVAAAPDTLRRSQTTRMNPAAYDEYMRGRYEYRRMSQPGAEGAITHFKRALAVEPRYARAHASLAQAYFFLGRTGAMSRDSARRAAQESANRALEVDATLPDAHAVLARLEADQWNFAEAEKRYSRAVQFDPSFVEPRLAFALFLAGRGRIEDALGHVATARNVDPLSPEVADVTATVYYYARRYPDALAEVQRAIRLDPDNVGSQLGLARVLNAMGRHEEALKQAERSTAQSGNHPAFQVEMALAEVGARRIANARRRVARLITRSGTPAARVTPGTLAIAYAPLDRDAAFKWLLQEFDARSASLLWVNVDPRLDPIRTDARFGELLKRLQLEP